MDVRCRLMLQVYPYLQHLDLVVDAYVQDDTFALLPRLRSLNLTHYQSDYAREQATETLCCDFQWMLSSLPHLTTLHCVAIAPPRSQRAARLEIASRSTLEEVRLHGYQQQLADEEWIGKHVQFPTSVEEDEIQLEQDAARVVFDGDIEEESDETALVARVSSTNREQLADGADDQKELSWVRDDMQRSLPALTRTQPTQRSCEVRLALVDWLRRRLRRGQMHTQTDCDSRPTSRTKFMMHRCRMLVRCSD